MTIHYDWPMCLDPIHKPPAPESPARPAVAAVRRHYAHSQWTVRCEDCVARIRAGLTDHPSAHATIIGLREFPHD